MTHADPTEQYDRDLEPVLPPSDVWAPVDPDAERLGVLADEDNSITLASGQQSAPLHDAHEPDPNMWGDHPTTDKRARQNEKLRGLGQEVLDRIWDEQEFRNDPRFTSIHALLNGRDEPTEEDANSIFSTLRAGNPGDMVEFITKSMQLPAAREAAVTKYIDYRGMLEDFS